ncbi:GATA transcription factor 8 [Momordica charantia]|uniref:GATA transcription factor 8 n=1 Tax=Momordica charantia TaxID=3673 RepID=A0A6J1CCA6_MOMCH|nr:GATA transcription factor 8 [Momordica charantia]
MIGNSFADEIDCGSFFDHIDDLLDFPVEDVDAGLPPAKGGDSANSFPTIWPTHSESLPVSDSVFSANSNSDLSAELSVPVSIRSRFLLTRVKVSCLQSIVFRSPSGHVTKPLLGPASTRPDPVQTYLFNNFSLAPLDQANQNSPSPPQSVRKCMHCEITKTPQWRAGPMGPKTLCNACGVRYKSGRLFPEYRPAASPTFIPSLHSNSHKKVLEMRSKTDDNTAIITISVQPELIPNTNSAISMDYM